MRKRLFLAPLMLLMLSACAAPPPEAPAYSVGAADTGDPALGLRYAQQTCASCHAVAAAETVSPNPDAPPFDTVANTPGMTRIALNVWLHTPHPTMPNFVVDPDRIDDLSAYLATLKESE
jgi:mono/diheme cytochrome c family protein